MNSAARKKLVLAFSAVVALAQVSFSACISGSISGKGISDAVVGDFGDAPDDQPTNYSFGAPIGNFPTRFSSDGARHLDLSDAAFGAFKPDGSLSVSAENDAVDPADPDGLPNIGPGSGSDNDAYDDGLLTTSFAPGALNDLSFLVSVAPTAPKMTRYVNILIDWNHDGIWSGTDMNGAAEHVVVNMPVDVTPGTTAALTAKDILAGVSNEPGWLRMTLTPEPIDLSPYPAGWDGTGEFAKGETEDYFLEDFSCWPLPDETGGGGGGPPPPFPPPFPPGGGGGGGGGGGSCEFWQSYNVTLCKGQSRRFLALVGGFAPDSVSADSNDSGTAGVEVNEANVTITGSAVGSTSIDMTVVEDGCTYHITVNVTVKDCSPGPKIECCTPAEIAKDPSRCKNCKVVGWKIHTNETPAGGGSSADGSISETGSHGDTSGSNSKSTVVMVGNVIKIITTYYQCEPCPPEGGCIPDEGDGDGDKIPDQQDWYPDECYDPDYPHSYEEQLWVDSFFDVFFNVNNDHGIYDERFFEPREEIPNAYPIEQPGRTVIDTNVGSPVITSYTYTPGTTSLY